MSISITKTLYWNMAWEAIFATLVIILNMSHMPSFMFLCACMYLVILGDGSSLWLWAYCTWSKYHKPRFLSCFTLTYAGHPHLFDPFSVLLGSSPLLPSYHPSMEHTRIVSIKYVSIVFCREHLPHYWHKHRGYIWILRGAQNWVCNPCQSKLQLPSITLPDKTKSHYATRITFFYRQKLSSQSIWT